jgi:hypothetical protein
VSRPASARQADGTVSPLLFPPRPLPAAGGLLQVDVGFRVGRDWSVLGGFGGNWGKKFTFWLTLRDSVEFL